MGGDTRRGEQLEGQEVTTSNFPRRESLPFTHCDSSHAHPLKLTLLYHFVQFGRPLSHLFFSDTVFERFKYFRIFWDFSKNKKCQPLAELIEMVQYHPKPKYKILHFTPAKLSNSPADGATSAIGEKFRVAGMPVEDCGRVAEVCR